MTASEASRDITAEETDRETPATAADWLEAGPEDRHPDAFEPVPYTLTPEAEAALAAPAPEADPIEPETDPETEAGL